jgi:hypothetical protein
LHVDENMSFLAFDQFARIEPVRKKRNCATRGPWLKSSAYEDADQRDKDFLIALTADDPTRNPPSKQCGCCSGDVRYASVDNAWNSGRLRPARDNLTMPIWRDQHFRTSLTLFRVIAITKPFPPAVSIHSPVPYYPPRSRGCALDEQGVHK